MVCSGCKWCKVGEIGFSYILLQITICKQARPSCSAQCPGKFWPLFTIFVIVLINLVPRSPGASPYIYYTLVLVWLSDIVWCVFAEHYKPMWRVCFTPNVTSQANIRYSFDIFQANTQVKTGNKHLRWIEPTLPKTGNWWKIHKLKHFTYEPWKQ